MRVTFSMWMGPGHGHDYRAVYTKHTLLAYGLVTHWGMDGIMPLSLWSKTHPEAVEVTVEVVRLKHD